MSIVSGLTKAESDLNYYITQDTMFASALSNASGMPDFKYVFDVYANGNQLTRVKLYPDPITAYGYFDAGPSVRNEIDYGWMIAYTDSPSYHDNIFITEPNQSGQIAINYDIRFGEEYISGGAYVSGTYVSGGTLVTLLNQASGTRKAYNFSAPIFNRKKPSVLINNKYLTNRPKKANCRIDGDLLIPFVSIVSAVKYGFQIIQYNASNGFMSIFDSYEAGEGTFEMTQFAQLNIGPVAINAFLADAGGTQIGSSTSYYDIKVINFDTGAVVSDIFRVYIDCNPKYDPIDLHFMNQYGMFDTARFDLASRLTMDIERKSFTKKDWRNGSASTVNYLPRQETKINYGSKMNWTYKLTMNYPTDEEYVWLAELIASPQIYANFPEVTDGCLMPITIKNTNYEYSTNQNNGLKVLEIEVELNQTRYGFLR